MVATGSIDSMYIHPCPLIRIIRSSDIEIEAPDIEKDPPDIEIQASDIEF